MHQRTQQTVGLAALIMMGSIFLSRVAGVFREMAIAAVAGADAAVDAYRVGFILPEILNHILASGFMSVTFIPIFAGYLALDDEDGGWRIFSIILTLFGALMALLVAGAMLLAPRLVPLLAPGRDDPQFLALAVHMTRITLPAQLFFFVGGMLMAVQFARRQFFIPALAPIVYNLGIIAGGWLMGSRIGVVGFAWGALGGAILGNFGIQLLGVWKTGLHYRPDWTWNHPDLRRYIFLTLPLMLGLTMIFSTEIFSKLFGSFLPEGAIAWLDYALRIMMLLVGFFGQAIGVASYPDMARMAAQKKMDDLNRLFNLALRYLALVLPVSAWVFVMRHEIVRLLFERGRFGVGDTKMTALALTGLLPGTVAFAAQTVVNRGFYAMQNTLLPAIYGTLAVGLSLPLYWLGMRLMGVPGVGLAISISALLQVWILFAIWNRYSENKSAGAVYRSYGHHLMATLPIGGLLWCVHRYLRLWIGAAGTLTDVGVMIAVGVLFVVLTALWGWLFKVEAILYIGRRLSDRLLRA